MNRDRYQQMRAAFLAARDASPDDRLAMLHQLAERDPELHEQVTRLLDQDSSDESLAEAAGHAHALGEPDAPQEPTMPVSVGPYRIIGKLGEGGMGVVLEAEQTEPRRRVALKVMRTALFSNALWQRFRQEIAALARLNHAGIAQIYDSGTESTPVGPMPYFAMELVEGVPINHYVESKKLSTHATLLLFLAVCDAVKHAHTKGVIHRDLKPANILIDPAGRPKVLDFGIARLIDSESPADAKQTMQGQILGTIAYMSPEQLRYGAAEADSRSDVFSLGVVLYELLTGRLPFDTKHVSLSQALETIEKKQPVALGTLNSRLRGDVNTIVHKALEKNRDRRYQTPADLARDISHYLNNEPIESRRSSVIYRASKFIQRHQVSSALAAALLLAITGSSIAMTILYFRSETDRERARLAEIDARRMAEAAVIAETEARAQADNARLEADAAEQTAQFLVRLFEVSDPVDVRDASLTGREILQRGADRIARELADHPNVRAKVEIAIGKVCNVLGLYDVGEPLLKAATESLETRFGPESAEAVYAKHEHASILLAWGKPMDAEPILQRVLEARRKLLGNDHPDTISTCNNLAVVLKQLGRLDEAEPHYREVVASRLRTQGPDHVLTLQAQNNFAIFLQARGAATEALEQSQVVLASRLRLLGSEHPDTLQSQATVAVLLSNLGKYAESEQTFRDMLPNMATVFGPEHPHTLGVRASLASAMLENGKLEKAMALFESACEDLKTVAGPDHRQRVFGLINLAVVHTRLGDHEQAQGVIVEAIESLKRTHPVDAWQHAHAGCVNGEVMARRGLRDEGKRLMQDALYKLTEALGEQHRMTRACSERLGALFPDVSVTGPAARP